MEYYNRHPLTNKLLEYLVLDPILHWWFYFRIISRGIQFLRTNLCYTNLSKTFILDQTHINFQLNKNHSRFIDNLFKVGSIRSFPWRNWRFSNEKKPQRRKPLILYKNNCFWRKTSFGDAFVCYESINYVLL